MPLVGVFSLLILSTFFAETMKTFFISEGKSYQNGKFNFPRLNKFERYHLFQASQYTDKVWVYFSRIETAM